MQSCRRVETSPDFTLACSFECHGFYHFNKVQELLEHVYWTPACVLGHPVLVTEEQYAYTYTMKEFGCKVSFSDGKDIPWVRISLVSATLRSIRYCPAAMFILEGIAGVAVFVLIALVTAGIQPSDIGPTASGSNQQFSVIEMLLVVFVTSSTLYGVGKVKDEIAAGRTLVRSLLVRSHPSLFRFAAILNSGGFLPSQNEYRVLHFICGSLVLTWFVLKLAGAEHRNAERAALALSGIPAALSLLEYCSVSRAAGAVVNIFWRIIFDIWCDESLPSAATNSYKTIIISMTFVQRIYLRDAVSRSLLVL